MYPHNFDVECPVQIVYDSVMNSHVIKPGVVNSKLGPLPFACPMVVVLLVAALLLAVVSLEEVNFIGS